MADQQLVCPQCAADRISSWENVPTLYHGTKFFLLDAAGGIEANYDAVYDTTTGDGGESTGEVLCQNCGWLGRDVDLVLPRVAAHKQPDVMKIEEDSDRGADVRWQAVCWAATHGEDVDYACGWCSPWEYADSYADEARRRVRLGVDKGTPVDPGQLAYEAAEAAGQQHLIEEGVEL